LETYAIRRNVMHGNFGILVLGHGSKLTHNKDIIEATAEMLAKKVDGAVVRTAYLNMNTPTVEEGLMSFKDTTVDRVYVLPLFLAHGVHTLEDIPEILGLKDGENRTVYVHGDWNVEVIYTQPLGSDECIANLAYKRLTEA
jgi:sirohydrochlorin ferrochelatase